MFNQHGLFNALTPFVLILMAFTLSITLTSKLNYWPGNGETVPVHSPVIPIFVWQPASTSIEETHELPYVYDTMDLYNQLARHDQFYLFIDQGEYQTLPVTMSALCPQVFRQKTYWLVRCRRPDPKEGI